MTLKPCALLLAALLGAAPAWAQITIEDAYARVASPMARTGAVYLVIRNDSGADDRLLGVVSDAAGKVALHAHVDQGDGVMRMVAAGTGIVIPAQGGFAMARGGDHVMFMGLTGRWAQGDMIPVTLIFEDAGEIAVDIPVDLARKPAVGGN